MSGLNSPRAKLAAAAASFVLAAARLAATSIIPISDDELLRRADAVVEGVVLESRPVKEDGVYRTRTDIRVLEVFKGQPGPVLRVTDAGGLDPASGGTWVPGRPRYEPGDRVIVFAIERPGGGWETCEFTLGKFSVVADAKGRLYAATDLVTRPDASGLRIRAIDGSDASDAPRDYEAFRNWLKGGVAGNTRTFFSAPIAAPEAIEPEWGSLTYSGDSLPIRWFTFDGLSPTPTAWTVSTAPALIDDGGLPETLAALAIWTNDPNSSIAYTYAGQAPSGTQNFIDRNAVSSQLGCGWTTAGCTGVVGCGGPTFTLATTAFKGTAYHSILFGYAEVRALSSLDCLPPLSWANDITHELGHTLGLAHSDQVVSPFDCHIGDEDAATMRSFLHSNAGASLGTDDREAIRYLYSPTDACQAPIPPPPGLALRFHTIAPCRLIDTRRPDGPEGGPALQPNTSREFDVAAQCGVPAGALAVSINATVASPTAAGDVRIFPRHSALPTVSTLNFPAGRTRANNAIAALSSDGGIAVQADFPTGYDTTQFLLDVNGYFQ